MHNKMAVTVDYLAGAMLYIGVEFCMEAMGLYGLQPNGLYISSLRPQTPSLGRIGCLKTK